MAAHTTEPEIVLYDLACTKNVCFSPVVWRIRLMLNYKGIPYKTIFLEFPDIEPRLKELGLIPAPSANGKYTVPAIHHVPSNTYLMDSQPIAAFLESTYANPPVPLSSSLGADIEAQSRSAIAPAFRTSVVPREIHILSPRSQEYFRRTREASMTCRLEDLLLKEDDGWRAVEDGMRQIAELLRTNAADGPFVLGARPSYTDFFVAGNLQSVRVIDEGVFERIVKYAGYKDVYEACLPYMEKRD